MLPSLTLQNIKLLNTYHISTDSLTLEDSPYRVIFEIQNRNMKKIIQLKAKTKLGFFSILNSRSTEEGINLSNAESYNMTNFASFHIIKIDQNWE